MTQPSELTREKCLAVAEFFYRHNPNEDEAIERLMALVSDCNSALAQRLAECQEQLAWQTTAHNACRDEITLLTAKLAAVEQERDELKGVVLSVYRSQMGVPAVQALDELRKVGRKYEDKP